MAIPSFVQSGLLATSSAAPASVAPTWSASAAGTLLCCLIGTANSAAPAIATPAGWTAGPTVIQGTACSIFSFYFPNNPGGNTGATFNLTNVNGAGAIMVEVSGINTAAPFDFASTRTNSNAGSTALSCPTYAPLYGNECCIAMEACSSAATFTDAFVNGTVPWSTIATATSTVGATNISARLALLRVGALATQGPNPSPLAQIVSTLSGSVFWCALTLCFLSTSSAPLNHGGYGQVATDVGTGFAVGMPG